MNSEQRDRKSCRLIRLVLSVEVICGSAAAAAPTVIFSDNFEGGDPYNAFAVPGTYTSWVPLSQPELCVQGGLWQIGVPTNPAGPGAASGGTRCASTGLTANMPPVYFDAMLASPILDLSGMASGFPPDEGLLLRFWMWRDMNMVMGTVKIGNVISDLEWCPVAWYFADLSVDTPYVGATGGWYACTVDLTTWRGKQIIIGFDLSGQGGNPGWFIDDVQVFRYQRNDFWHGTTESFENGWGLWGSDYGGWDVGTAVPHPRAPSTGADGAKYAGTGMRGAAPIITHNHLLTPPIYVQKESGQILMLEFSYWSDYGAMGGYVQFSTFVDISPFPAWFLWQNIGDWTIFGGRSTEWQRARIDLSQIVGVSETENSQPFRLGFYNAGGDGLGWFIDRVTVRGMWTMPEADVLLNGAPVVDGATAPIYFGSVGQGTAPAEKTFTIANSGLQPLTVGTVYLDNNTGFNVSRQPQPGIPAGEETTFRLRMLTDTAGSKSADVRFATNDPDEAEYNFKLAGTVTAPPRIQSAASRRSHGSAGEFSIGVLSSSGIECRTGGPMRVVVVFDQPIQQAGGIVGDVSVSSGTVSALAVSGSELTITMSGATDAALLTIGFPGIQGTSGQAATGELCVGVLLGDANSDRAVNIFDLIAIRNTLNQPVTQANFRSDVTADGNINIFDLIATRNNLNRTLLTACP